MLSKQMQQAGEEDEAISWFLEKYKYILKVEYNKIGFH